MRSLLPSLRTRQKIGAAIVAFLIIFAVVQLLHGAEVPSRVPSHSLVRVKATADEICHVLNKDLSPVDIATTADGLVFTGPPGRYAVLVTNIVTKAPQTLIVDIGGTAPTPPPDPQPDVDPTPDQPAPIPDPGLRVLVVYESAALPSLPAEQRSILFDAEIRAFMTEKCVKVNNVAEWRMVDQNVPIVSTSPIWKKAFARPRASVPWLIISNGKSGYEGPLPANKTEMLDVLRRFAQ